MDKAELTGMAAAVVTTAARTKRTKFFLNCMVKCCLRDSWYELQVSGWIECYDCFRAARLEFIAMDPAVFIAE